MKITNNNTLTEQERVLIVLRTKGASIDKQCEILETDKAGLVKMRNSIAVKISKSFNMKQAVKGLPTRIKINE